MGYRCRWQTIGRNDHEEIEALEVDKVEAIGDLKLSLAEGMKTIYDVYNDNGFIGQVRTTFGGQFFRTKPESEFIYVIYKWNENDPKHGHALAALLADDELRRGGLGGVNIFRAANKK